ncbi:ABC transporter substrate-binding protein [candidate division KSB3 bacterium]|uniref:ABC transporter substrate-binding protein n=1 Tax=candidate division KSB3 bacterium TaxID=2044937 RepID=A0A9D5JYF8_9BACT|nr:ABC transporter substrate-binding protein [candidate division KSB3 bacterium]MBD3326485.1 ABC transporter substrate-binding protein [candidate division KSB3 bacterium]
MKKQLFLVTLLVFALGLSSAFALEDEWGVITIPEGESLHLGFAAALTGDYANLGLDERDGMILALEDQNSEVLGFPIEALVEDDQCEGSPAMAIAEKFVSDPLFVGLIGHMCSPSSIPASKTYEKHGFSMISPSTTAAEYTARGMENVFRTCFSDDMQGKVAAEYAYNVLELKTAAVLHDKSSYGQPIAENFKNTFESLGGKVVTLEGLTRGDKDFRPILTKIKPMNPQIVYFGGMAAEGALVARQMRDVGIKKAVFISDDGCYSVPDFIEGAGEASEGAYITFAQPKGAEYDAWEQRFTERFEHEPITFSPQTYDATMAMLKAIEQVGQVQDDGSLMIGKKALADAIRNNEFEGVTGKVAFTESGDSKSGVVVYQVQGKEFVVAPGQNL